MKNFVKHAIDQGGKIKPILIPADQTNGTGLMNPSIINDNGVLRGIVRHVNYTFYHSEKKLFQHPYGPLTYIHPEHDLHLRTTNWYVEYDEDLNITRFNKIDTSRFDVYEPKWEFIGLEDARIIRWDGDLWITGVRRDTTTNGEGRMELSKLEITKDSVVEVQRHRIEPPLEKSYCEKNWMPILDKPWHYVKWTNPTEVVKVNKDHGVSKTVSLSEPFNVPVDLRGGAQVVRFGDVYVGLTHEVDLFQSEAGRKDAVYRHRFVVWDEKFNVVKYSKDFHFMDGQVEFSIGMCHYNEDVLITFGFQDNAAYILKVKPKTIMDFIDDTTPILP